MLNNFFVQERRRSRWFTLRAFTTREEAESYATWLTSRERPARVVLAAPRS
jgi:hypothetical protein